MIDWSINSYYFLLKKITINLIYHFFTIYEKTDAMFAPSDWTSHRKIIIKRGNDAIKEIKSYIGVTETWRKMAVLLPVLHLLTKILDIYCWQCDQAKQCTDSTSYWRTSYQGCRSGSGSSRIHHQFDWIRIHSKWDPDPNNLFCILFLISSAKSFEWQFDNFWAEQENLKYGKLKLWLIWLYY